MTDPNPSTPLIIPALGNVYTRLHSAAETLLRIVCGVAFAIHGWPKIIDPFGNIEFVQNLGFYPGVLWSPLLAMGEFLGGVFLAIGFLTRPSALVGTVILLVIVWVELVVRGDGYMAAEKAIIWSTLMFYFVVRGPNRHSVDAKIGKAF